MGVYDQVNTIDADTEQEVSRDNEKQEQRPQVPDSLPLWPNSNLPRILQNNSKMPGDATPTSPITPGGNSSIMWHPNYYETIQSTSSRR